MIPSNESGLRAVDLDDSRTVALLSAGVTAMRLAHAGHRVLKVFQEAWQAEHAYITASAWCSLGAHPARAARRPTCMNSSACGAAKRRAACRASRCAKSSNTQAPRFHLRGSEQRLLRRALFDETDEQIAELPGISAQTLKKAVAVDLPARG